MPARANAPADLLDRAAERRRNWRQLLAAEAGLLGLLLFLGAGGLMLAVAALLGRAPGLGRLIGTANAIAAVGLALWYWLQHWWRSRDLASWAAWQADEGRAGPGAELLRSALEIAEDVLVPLPAGVPPLGSTQLIEKTLMAGAQGLEAVDRAQERIRRRLGRLGAVAAATALAWLFSAWAFPGTWQHLLRQPVGVGPTVRDVGTLIADSRIYIEPPPYARSAVPARAEEGGDVTVLRGSHVLVTASALPDFEVKNAELQVQQADGGARTELVAVTALGGRIVQWGRAVLEPTRYRYRGLDPNGQPVREAGWRELRNQADEAPTVAIRQPSGEIEVRAGQNVVLDGEARDDIGLQLVDLVIARPSTGVERRPVQLTAGEVRADVRETIAVDTLQLRPGEVALVHLEAADNNPLDGKRRSQSAKLRVRMFSAERHHARGLEQLAQLTQFWTLRLADRLERDPAQRQAGLDWALKNRAELVDAEQQGIDELRSLRQHLQDDVLSRPRTIQDLEEIERQLAEPMADEARVLYRIDPAAAGYSAVRDLYTVQRLHAVVLAAQEKAVVAMAALASAEHQNALARDGLSLAETEKQLVSTLEKLADGGAAPLQAEAERLLDAVEQQLDRMASAAQKQAAIVPSEHVNAAALDPSGLHRDLADHRTALAEVRQLLRQGKAREALEKMRQIREAMGGRLADLRQGVDQERTAEESALQRLVRELRRGIDKTLDGQGRVRDDLRDASEEQGRATAEHLRDARNGMIKQAIELLEEARGSLRPQRLATPELHGSRPLATARAALGTALQALEAGQLDGALQALIEAQDELGAARRDLESGKGGKAAALDTARLDDATDKIDRAAARLREALPRPDTLLRPATRQHLEQDAAQEEQLRRNLEKLRQKLGQAGSAHPALQRQVGDRLDHALQTMREVIDSLQRYDASRAFEQTAEVLDALERAAAMLDDQGSGQAGQPQAGEQVGYDTGSQRVELRSGNQGDAVETFRQEVLKALQQRQPQQWQDRLQRYYKAIAR